MLPKLDTPIYNIELPLSKKKLRYRSFLVKEEKILLMAMESNDENIIVDSIKQVLNNCCLDEIDVDELPVIDLEYFFLRLRAKSVNEISELQYKCNNKIKDDAGTEKTCGNLVRFDLNLLEVEPEIDPKHTNKIELSNKMGIVMKYPNVKLTLNVDEGSEIEKIMNIIVKCIDFIYDEDNIYYSKDISKEELMEFVESMNKNQFEKLQNFFNTLPKMKKILNFHCGKCNHKENIVIEGLQNFFV
jgi:hypothetical protein